MFDIEGGRAYLLNACSTVMRRNIRIVVPSPGISRFARMRNNS